MTNLITEIAQAKALKISRLENYLFSGSAGVEYMVIFLDALLESANTNNGGGLFTLTDLVRLRRQIDSIKSLIKILPVTFLNRISVNPKYNQLIKNYEKYKLLTATPVNFLTFVNDYINKEILELKRADAIQRKQLEKRNVLEFFGFNRKNTDNFYLLKDEVINIKNFIMSRMDVQEILK